MKRVLFAAFGLMMATLSWAGEGKEIARVREALQQLIPNESPDAIEATPVPGLYEVTYGAQLFYVSADGRYLMNGDLVDLKGQTNLTEGRRARSRAKAIERLGTESLIVYRPEGGTKYVVNVFTDIDCGYCRKLHGGMKEMNELGIEVRYLAFPRSGPGTASFDKAVSVWCAKDRKAAMDAAKTGDGVEPAKCKAPVDDHYALGQALGVNGTPALLLADGRMIPGYLPPKRLLQLLQEKR